MSHSDEGYFQRPRATSAASQQTLRRQSTDRKQSKLDDIPSGMATSGAFKVLSSTSSEDEVEEVKQLARQVTRASTYSNVGPNPFDHEEGGVTDPSSDNFRVRAFIKSMLKLQQNEGGNIGRSAGFAFRNLSAYGYGAGTDYQETVGNTWLKAIGGIKRLAGVGQRRIDILRNFDGLVHAGEMLVVLGPPGSGCSTLLKTITGETHGYTVDKDSYINYQGISFEQMHHDFRGESIYTAEVDVHFPQMTVGETLYFAARARAPRTIPGGLSKHEFAQKIRDVVMATFGIRHTINTKVGNDFVRGVSGGERKRVTIVSPHTRMQQNLLYQRARNQKGLCYRVA